MQSVFPAIDERKSSLIGFPQNDRGQCSEEGGSDGEQIISSAQNLNGVYLFCFRIGQPQGASAQGEMFRVSLD